MLKLFKYLKPYLWQSILLLVMIGLQVWTSLQLPALMADIINEGIMKNDLDYVWRTGILMIGLAVFSSICAFTANFLSARIGTAFSRDVRNDFFKQVLSFSIADIDKFSLRVPQTISTRSNLRS